MQSIFAKQSRGGFTVVEIVIVVTVLGLLTTVVFGALQNLYTSIASTQTRTVQETDTLGSLRAIEKDLSNNAGIVASLATAAPYGDNGSASWSYLGAGEGKRVLIAKTYLTTAGQDDANRQIVFKKVGADCTGVTEPALATQVYFLAADSSNGTFNLYRRTILPSTNVNDYCDGTPFQKQTCATAACANKDAILLRNVTAFNVDYFAAATDLSPSVASTNNTNSVALVNAARSVKITVASAQPSGSAAPSTGSIKISTGVATNLGAGLGDGSDGSGATDPAPGASTQYFATNGSYTIPSTANFIDIVLIGGGGGGQGGGFFNSSGHGGSSGNWNYATLRRDVDIDRKVTQLSVSIGDGGASGRGFGSGFDYTLLGAENGKQGGSTAVSAVIPNASVQGGLGALPIDGGPQALQIQWSGLTATGGGGGRTPPNNNDVPGFKAVPYTLYYLGKAYNAGAPGPSAAQVGTAPGGGGAGGWGAVGFLAGKGANGASGGAWIRSY